MKLLGSELQKTDYELNSRHVSFMARVYLGHKLVHGVKFWSRKCLCVLACYGSVGNQRRMTRPSVSIDGKTSRELPDMATVQV